MGALLTLHTIERIVFLSEGRKGNCQVSLKVMCSDFLLKACMLARIVITIFQMRKGSEESNNLPRSFIQPLHVAEPGLEPGLSESRVHSYCKAPSCLFERRLWVEVHTFLSQLQDNQVGVGLLALKHDN